MTVALAISIAIHEIVAGAVPPNAAVPSQRVRVVQVRLTTIAARPAPTPAPSVRATPTARPRVAPSFAPRAFAGAAAPAPHAAPSATIHRTPPSRPVWDPASSGTGPAAAVGAASSGSAAGTNGTGTSGNGPAAATADQPCGFVTFSDPHGSQYDARTKGFWVDIRMSVHFADGSSQSVMLDYPWYYASEAANPWSDQNLRDPNFPTRFQPPPAAKAAAEPPVVQYVVAHSTPDGMTLLQDCPTPRDHPHPKGGR